MSRRVLAALVLVLTPCLTGCLHGAQEDRSAGGDVVTSLDGSFTIAMPDGWDQRPVPEGKEAVLNLYQKNDKHHQVMANTFDTAGGAEYAAIYAATGIYDSLHVACRRLEHDTTFGSARLVFDCPFADPEPFHKILVPYVDGDRSVLVLVQVDGTELGDTAPLVTPFLESFSWQ